MFDQYEKAKQYANSLRGKFKSYVEANSPKNMGLAQALRNSAKVVDDGLLNPNEYNAPAANRFKDSVFGLLGIVPGVGDAASAAEAADLFNRGENFAGSMAALGALPLVPAIGGMLKQGGRAADVLRPSGLLGVGDNAGMDYVVNSRGSMGHEIVKDGKVVGLVKTGKAKDAIGTFMKQQNDALMAKKAKAEAAKASSANRAARKAEIEALSLANAQYADVISSAHKNKNLEFMPLPDGVFGMKGNPLIHQSPSYGKKPGSTYKLVMVDGRPAYARESDHWGMFSTNDFVNGEQVSNTYNWPLSGVETKPYGDIRRSGYVLLDDLLKK